MGFGAEFSDVLLVSSHRVRAALDAYKQDNIFHNTIVRVRAALDAYKQDNIFHNTIAMSAGWG